jgi:predicted  nucleic acid-binding Zn-ribbon protein
MLVGSPDVSRRQDEWEEAIQSLDQKEIELHQCQVRLMREQNSTIMRDLRSLAHDVDLLKARQVTNEDRVTQLEQASTETPGVFEQHRNELQAIRESLGNHVKDFEGLRVSHAHHAIALPERMYFLESTLKEVTSSLQKDVQVNNSAQAWNDAVHAKLARDFEEAKANQGTIEATGLGRVERMVDEAIRKHSAELHSLRAACEKHTKEVQTVAATTAKQASELQTLKFAHGRHTRDFEGLRANQTCERLTALEQIQAESFNRHEEAMLMLKEAQAKIAADLISAKAAQFHHSEVEARLTAAENALREAAKRHSDAHMRHVSERGQLFEQALGEANAAQAALRERGQLLEQALGEAKGRQGFELANLQFSHERLCSEVQEIKATLKGDFERMLGESVGKHAQDLHGHRTEHREELGKVGSSLELVGRDLQELKAQYETHGQRLGRTEAAHAELAESRAQELNAVHGHLEALGGHHERHSTTVQELERALRVELADIIARIEALGGRIENDRGVIEKHSATLQELTGIVDSKLEPLNGRLEHERLARDRQYVSVQELAAGVDTKVEALSSRFEADRVARDRQYLSVQDAVLREKDQRDGHNASLKENLAYLETIIGNVSDRHGKDIVTVKDSNGKLVKEMRVLTNEMGELQARMEKLRSRVPLVRGLWAEGLAIDGRPE